MAENTRQHYRLATGEGVTGMKKGGPVKGPAKPAPKGKPFKKGGKC